MPTTTQPRSTDPSAALVERIAAEALNPAYATSTARRSRRGSRRRPEAVLVTVAIVAIVGLLVGVLVVAARQGAATVDSERTSLLALATERQAEVAVLQERAATLSDEVRVLREDALADADLGAAQAGELDDLGVQAGTRAVVGPGARVVVDDAEPGSQDSIAISRVLDIDLQQVVNGLWESGAESVAINGQRVGALTAIRSVQETILVNYEPVVAPYVVAGIGDPQSLPTDFLRSSGGDWLQAVNLSAGIRFSIDSVSDDDRRLPSAPAGSLRYATPDLTPDAETS